MALVNATALVGDPTFRLWRIVEQGANVLSFPIAVTLLLRTLRCCRNGKQQGENI